MVTVDLGSLLGAFALVAIPLITWLSGRFTREARLLQRIDRWGKAYAALPDSPSKASVGDSLVELGDELSAWIDINSRSLRTWRNWSSFAAFVVAIVVGLALQPLVGDEDQIASFVLLTGCGVVAGALSVLLTELIERRAVARSQRESSEAKEVAFRAGIPMNHLK